MESNSSSDLKESTSQTTHGEKESDDPSQDDLLTVEDVDNDSLGIHLKISPDVESVGINYNFSKDFENKDKLNLTVQLDKNKNKQTKNDETKIEINLDYDF